MILNSNIDTIIFDLGNTILPISPTKTINNLKTIGLTNNKLESMNRLFINYELGKITTLFFIQEIKKNISKKVPHQEIIDAWNAMILDYPQPHIDFLQEMKRKYQIILLSNTNELHYNCFIEKAKKKGVIFEALFHATYYSHKLGMRKPQTDIFEFVIESHHLSPQKTLFVDDLEENIIVAENLGLTTYHLKNNHNILDLS